jgi:curved DNA-binding protein CbpA
MREALDLLGIAGEPGDVDEVKKIHRTLIMKYHPDRFADDEEFRSMAEEKARRINMAWDFVRKRLENE